MSLDALPFPVALAGPVGLIVAHNREWADARVDLHQLEALQAGIRAVLGGKSKRCSQPIEQQSLRYRATITPQEVASRPGALIVLERLEHPPPGDKSRESEKMAVVGRLLGGVVHDFANLLTLISGHSEILLSRLGEHHVFKDELDEIRKAANRGARLTSQLLSFTRGRTAPADILDLNEIVTGIVRMVSPVIGENLHLDTDLAADLGRVLADTGQIEQVLTNLLLNARDAMPHGGRIVIETRNWEMSDEDAHTHGLRSGRYVMLSVGDTGRGIDPGLLDRLWDPFFTTKPEGTGIGLGLSNVKKIIQESRGAVWVESVPGLGATFFVSLPQVQAGVASGRARPGTVFVPRPSAVCAKTGNETILVAEDEEGVRRLLRHVLEVRGYKVLEASDGEQALRLYQQSGPVHLVVTDMIMPRLGGRELAKRLAILDPNVRIMFMSGYTDDVLVRTGELASGMVFLQKPLRPETLASKVREALDSPSRPFNPR